MTILFKHSLHDLLPRLLLAGLLGLCAWAVSVPAGAQTALPPPVSWSASQQRASGLRIEHLAVRSYRRKRLGMAEVLDPGRLLQAQAALDDARARRAQARAELELATLRSRQARALFAAGQDVAQATVEQARAGRLRAQAGLAAAQSALRAARAERAAVLGPTLGRRLRRQPGLADALAQGRERVLRVLLPPGRRLAPGARVRVRLPAASDSTRSPSPGVPLRLLGPAPRAGEISQGLAYLGLARASDALQPGLRLEAVIESATPRQGVWLPASAVLFHGGRAFVFVASAPASRGDRQFTARQVSTRWPLDGGYVQPGWPATDVVSGGAGLLLTPPPEAHTLPPAGNADDGDD